MRQSILLLPVLEALTMQNCIDYVTLNQKKAIVVTTDLAKYEIQQENIQLPALLCSSLQIHAS
jgi:hypothetical protein